MIFLRNGLLSAILFLTLNSGALAQVNSGPWSLRQCIQYARDNNIRIKQMEIGAKVAEEDYQQSRLDLIPSLNASASHTFRTGRSYDEASNAYFTENFQNSNFGIQASTTLFNGLVKQNTIKREKYNLLLQMEAVKNAVNDISIDICLYYLQILFDKELLAVAENQLEITQQQYERTGQLVDAGKQPRGDLLEIQAQIASEELEIVNQKNAVDLGYLKLVQLLELKTTEDFEIEDPEISEIRDSLISLTVLGIYGEAVETLPEIKLSEYSLESSKAGLDIARGSQYPRLSANAGYGSQYTDALALSFSDQLRNNESSYVGLGLSIPIFNGWYTRTAISKLKLQILNSEFELQNSKNELFAKIQQAHADAKAALKKYAAAKKSVESLQESFRYTEEKYNVGLVTTVDYNIAKNNLTEAESQLLQAKYEYIFKKNILLFYRGQPLQI